MDEIEVDGVGPEPLEALLAGFDDVIRVALGSRFAVRKANVAGLGGEDVLFASVSLS
jgi:hypothetical protein